MIINIPSIHGREGLEAGAIVVHAAAEYIRLADRDIHIVDFLRSRGESAHAYVLPSGDIIRTRRDDQIAWHCKAQGFNFKSLGMEFLVAGAYTYDSFLTAIKTDWVTEEQYAAGVQLARDWQASEKLVVRHCDVDPERKSDPGNGFPWQVFLDDIRGEIGGDNEV